MSKVHFLKTWPKFFEHVRARKKTFEYRKNDRNFQFGDYVILQEWDPDRPYIDKVPGPLGEPKGYSGREDAFRIGYILPIPDTDFVVFSLLQHEQEISFDRWWTNLKEKFSAIDWPLDDKEPWVETYVEGNTSHEAFEMELDAARGSM